MEEPAETVNGDNHTGAVSGQEGHHKQPTRMGKEKSKVKLNSSAVETRIN